MNPELKKSTLLGPAVRRLQKELQRLVTSPADGIKVSDETCNASDLAFWKVDVTGPKETLFEGENFQLSFQFNGKYPFDSPIVTFTGDSIPMHPHVYRLFFMRLTHYHALKPNYSKKQCSSSLFLLT